MISSGPVPAGTTALRSTLASIALTLSTCLCVAGAQTGSWERVLAAEGLAYRDLAPGVQYATMDYKGNPRPLAYHVVKVDLADRSVSLGAIRSEMTDNGTMVADTLTNMVRLAINQRPGSVLVAAINADYFDSRPLGGHIQSGDPITLPNKRSMIFLDTAGRPAISVLNTDILLRFGDTGEWTRVTSINNCLPKKGMPDTVNLPSAWRRFTLRDGDAAMAEITSRTPQCIAARIVLKLLPGATVTNTGNHLLVWSSRGKLASCMRTDETVSLMLQSAPVAVEAVGGGPRIVRDGKASIEFDAEGWTPVEAAKVRGPNPRTASGVSRDGKTAFLVVVEGRKSTSQGLDAADLAKLLINLGCWDAMNHDGGGSASLYTPASFVINQGQPRPVKNGLAVFRRAGE